LRAGFQNERQTIDQNPDLLAAMAQQNFAAVFPEGLTPLAQADPEVYSIIKDEEERQWYARWDPLHDHSAMARANNNLAGVGCSPASVWFSCS
jgi:L-rhamnose mutarotase